jgi:hypothetical protein
MRLVFSPLQGSRSFLKDLESNCAAIIRHSGSNDVGGSIPLKTR